MISVHLGIAVMLLFDAGCETCGPPAEPLINVRVTLAADVVPTPSDYLHLQMLNAEGTLVARYDAPVSSIARLPFDLLLGACDGSPQTSGRFTIRAWLDEAYDPVMPVAADPQGSDVIDVTCTPAAGCVAARDSAIAIAR